MHQLEVTTVTTPCFPRLSLVFSPSMVVMGNHVHCEHGLSMSVFLFVVHVIGSPFFMGNYYGDGRLAAWVSSGCGPFHPSRCGFSLSLVCNCYGEHRDDVQVTRISTRSS